MTLELRCADTDLANQSFQRVLIIDRNDRLNRSGKLGQNRLICIVTDGNGNLNSVFEQVVQLQLF